MTLATFIKPADFDAIVDAAFEAEAPHVTAAESELGEQLEHFADAAAIKAKAVQCITDGITHYAFALWYPSTGGQAVERRVELDPPRDGKTFRYSLGGWGVIQLHLYVTPPGTVQCRVAANSQARAQARQVRYTDLGPADAWDWAVIDQHVFRLSRRLAKMGKTGPVGKAPTPWDIAAMRKRS